MHQRRYKLRADNIHEGDKMDTNDMMAEIRDANLSYLMLAQQMIRADKPTAIFRLGISGEIADLLEGLNNAQILKLAGTNMMLARFRFDDGAILKATAIASFYNLINRLVLALGVALEDGLQPWEFGRQK